jgi:site-specific recombinase XerD
MIEYFYSDPKVLRNYRTGPLGPHLDRFAQWLKQTGYTWLSGQDKLRIVVQLNQWLIAKRYRLSQLNEQLVCDFEMAQRKYRTSHHGEKSTLARLLRLLRETNLIPALPVKKAHSPLELLVMDYAQFLIQERCLSHTSLVHRLPIARQFLTYCFRSEKIRLNTLQPCDISRFVFEAVREQRRHHCQLVTTTLRSFLDFLYQHGRLKRSLRAAVPTVASGRPADLPVFLEPDQIEQVLRSCDRSTLCGRRDYAILLLLARLGLRAHEVCSLTLEDINWASGEVTIRGKGGREDRLPLPPDVGRALATYIKQGRPSCSCRSIFLCLNAPYRGMVSSPISSVVERALARTDIVCIHKGSHLLRHSLATRMLRGGASLAQIGQILRHRHIDTTEIYARVDQKALRALAQPWPGGVR